MDLGSHQTLPTPSPMSQAPSLQSTLLQVANQAALTAQAELGVAMSTATTTPDPITQQVYACFN